MSQDLSSHAFNVALGGLRRMRSPRRRSFLQFAEEELVIPDGPFEGRRFRADRQPFTRHLLREFDNEHWNRFAVVASQQTGKSLLAFVLPILYHLFEVRETVIVGVPSLDVAADKWREDIEPALRRTKYWNQRPGKGGGSRGGKTNAIHFKNGTTLRFMTAGGGDKSRAGYTARVLVVTEADGFDVVGATSREADKLSQIEGRTRAFGDRKRVYLECTASTEDGRIWREYTNGSASQLYLRCPHCERWVLPEREHLLGWVNAVDEAAAREGAAFHCPRVGCGVAWTEDDRREANLEMRVAHRGQEVNARGEVVGDLPRTRTLGFRWNAVNSLFATAADAGQEEWECAQRASPELERKLLQFVWALPWRPDRVVDNELTPLEIARRLSPYGRGVVPKETVHLTIGVDVGKYRVHYVAIAWGENARAYVVDYGVRDVASRDLGIEVALASTLQELADDLDQGFPDPDGERIKPSKCWVDAAYESPVVYAFVRDRWRATPKLWWPIHGRGEAQDGPTKRRYEPPRKRTEAVAAIGEHWHVSKHDTAGFLVWVNVDRWKTWVQERLAVPVHDDAGDVSAGAMVLYKSDDVHHHRQRIARHLCAEKRIVEFLPGRGVVERWEKLDRENHWLDAAVYASGAAHMAGVRADERTKPRAKKPARARARAAAREPRMNPGIRIGSGRPFLANRR